MTVYCHRVSILSRPTSDSHDRIPVHEPFCGFSVLYTQEHRRRDLILPMTPLKQRTATSSAVLLILSVVLTAGCSDAGVTGTVTDAIPTSSGSLLVSGTMTPQRQYIRVSRGGAPVTNADVTVNGVPIPHRTGDLYSGSLPEPVAAGGTLNLKVVTGGVSFEAPGEVTMTPVITAPRAGSSFASTDAVNLTWSTSADPDRFEVCLNCWENSLYGGIYTVSGSTREFKIAPGALVDFGTGAPVFVTAFKSNFLESARSPHVTTNVQFVADSREALITIKY